MLEPNPLRGTTLEGKRVGDYTFGHGEDGAPNWSMNKHGGITFGMESPMILMLGVQGGESPMLSSRMVGDLA